MTGHEKSDGIEQPYRFGKLALTDDDSVASVDDPRMMELGTIRLVLDWVQVVEQLPFRPTAEVQALGPVHERTKKARSHNAELGEARRSTKKQWFTTTSIGRRKTTVVFQYAPEDWLQARGIITAPADVKPIISASGSHAQRLESLRHLHPINHMPSYNQHAMPYRTNQSSGSSSSNRALNGLIGGLTHMSNSLSGSSLRKRKTIRSARF